MKSQEEFDQYFDSLTDFDKIRYGAVVLYFDLALARHDASRFPFHDYDFYIPGYDIEIDDKGPIDDVTEIMEQQDFYASQFFNKRGGSAEKSNEELLETARSEVIHSFDEALETEVANVITSAVIHKPKPKRS